jgi:NAD(P)-dependent dehydrogenase (short-subunit alcohol dehydrogenase family)
MKSVVITGVSTGIGYATVEAAIRAGYQVFGSVRTQADAERLLKDFPKHFLPLVFDVTDADGIARAASMVSEVLGDRTLDALIHNAGIAVAGPLLHLPMDEVRQQFEVNVFSVVAVTQAFAPILGADRARQGAPGKIIAISSVAGKNSSPFVGAYAASKHALEGLCGTLRRELMLHGIDVIIVGPGAIRTPIWDKPNLAPYASTPYGPSLKLAYDFMMDVARKGLAPEQCAALLVEILEASKPKARYALVPQPLMNWWLPRILPARWVDKIVAQRLGLKRS